MPRGRSRTAAQAYEQAKRVVNKEYGHINYSNVRPVTLENMKRSGVDCSGFIYWIFGFSEQLSTAKMIGTQVMQNADFIRLAYGSTPLQKGDVLCYTDTPMGHTTFYIGNGQIYHSTTGGPQKGGAPGGPMTTIFRPKEGWDEVPILWTPF